MKLTIAMVALLGLTSAIKLQQAQPITFAHIDAPCEALEMTQEELDVQLDYFSRKFEQVHYDNAMKIYAELKKQGKNPKVKVHTWQLYDKAFSFDRVRRYQTVQDEMDKLEHFQDNLNMNFTNSKLVADFIKVAKEARAVINEKYHDGEFADPAQYDPEADHPVTWANMGVKPNVVGKTKFV